MKKLKIYALSLLPIIFWGCQDGIDDITKVDPGPDESAPQVIINYPTEGTKIKVLEVTTSITIDFQVTDDIEVGLVTVKLDNNTIATYNQFKDYRRVLVDDLVYDGLDDGTHVLSVVATDLDGKTTTQSVNFEKEPAYVPIYAGETLYMPFDGDYFDLVNIAPATRVGSPGFAGESIQGLNAYAGAADSYLTVPAAGIAGNEFSAVFWYKVNASPDRAGILVAGPEDAANPTAQNNRTSGFRLFRENAGGKQRFKLNVGTGTGEAWFDGGAAADLPADAGWAHIAITISQTSAAVYINGQVVSSNNFSGINWTGVDMLSIMSGAPRFTGWGHLSDQSFMDELRMFNRSLSQSEIQTIMMNEAGGYVPEFDGEQFYMPFDGDYLELVSNRAATTVGTPGFAGSGLGGTNAYIGAADSYLTFPTAGLTTPEFSATFWYNVNASPDRAGILVVGPPDAENPDAQNLRTSGFRFFREGSATNQIFKLNVGNGSGESWFDGGAAATLPSNAGWVHMAFTISGSNCVVYINGEIVSQGSFTGISWSNCDIISIGSGAPRFTGWGHLSDQSQIDELRLFSKALTQEEVNNIMNSDL